ncbi:hypothetical protein PAMP_002267 [Pampus punctatissimus]
MDASTLSVLSYMRSKPLGKLRQRIQDLRIPSSSSYNFIASRPTLDLSHNEIARLAADCLLNRGLEGYQEVLNAEGEVDFLSHVEKNYIKENVRDANTVDPGASDDDDKELESSAADSPSPKQSPAVSTDSDTTVPGLDLDGLKDVKWSDPVLDKSSIEVFFQSDSRAAGMKDLVRKFITKARTVLVIVIDSFSDVELLCDLLDASRKNVSVHLLLDHLNLYLFVSMWQELKLNWKDFPVHRSLAVLVKGSAVKPFHQEFHRLYCSSKAVPGFDTAPHAHLLSTTSHAVKNDNTGISRSISSHNKTMCWALSEDAQNTQTKVKMAADVLSSGLSNPSAECSKGDINSLSIAGTQTQIHMQTQLCPTTVVQAGTPQSVSVEKPNHAGGAVFTQHDTKTNTESLEKDQNQTQRHSNPLGQTHVSYIQPQLTGYTTITTITTTTTTAAERAAKFQESNTLASLTQAQPRTVRYQSPFKINSNLDQHNVGTEALFFQQRNRHRITQPSMITAGLNTQRGQWSYPLNLKQKGDFPTKMHLQPSPRLNWSHTERRRPVAQHSSFSRIGQEMGGQLGWRTFQTVDKHFTSGGII